MKILNPYNLAALRAQLATAYTALFVEDPGFAHVALTMAPEVLAQRMADAAGKGSANIDGPGFRRACKALGIPCTHKAVDGFIYAPLPSGWPTEAQLQKEAADLEAARGKGVDSLT